MPGRSTDYDAVRFAAENNVKEVYNLSNVPYFYSQDPHRYASAKPLFNVTWREFFAIAGKRWQPGMNLPFDPIAARLAAKNNLTVKILQGSDFANIEKAIAGKKFTGTTLSTGE